jgi:hypothetical protein
MRLLLTLLILLITTPASAPVYDSVGRARATLAHRYHGIYFSTYGRVQDTFERDGKRCRLFTKGREENMERVG